MNKLFFVTLCLGAQLAGAETVLNKTAPLIPPVAGHWAITHQTPVDQNKNGHIERTEWKQPTSDRPWNRPQYLEGQTQRWNVQWVSSPAPAASKPVSY